MRSLAKHMGRSSEGRRVRFLGYGPGRFFVGDVAGGSGTSLNLPNVFDDDDSLVGPHLFRIVGSFVVGSVLLINSPSADDGIVEVDDVWDNLNWDGDVGQKKVWVCVNAPGWGISWVFLARDVSCMYCAIVLLQ